MPFRLFITVTSPIDVYVPTRGPLAVKAKCWFVLIGTFQ